LLALRAAWLKDHKHPYGKEAAMAKLYASDVANRADYDEDLQEALEKISTRRSFWSRLWS